MPEPTEQILWEIKELKSWLYGANGHEGDIPEIKAGLKNHAKRIRIIELILAASGILGGGTWGIVKLLGS